MLEQRRYHEKVMSHDTHFIFNVSELNEFCFFKNPLPRKSSPDKGEQSLAACQRRLILNCVKMAQMRNALLMCLDRGILLDEAPSEEQHKPSEVWQRVCDGWSTKERIVEF